MGTEETSLCGHTRDLLCGHTGELLCGHAREQDDDQFPGRTGWGFSLKLLAKVVHNTEARIRSGTGAANLVKSKLALGEGRGEMYVGSVTKALLIQ